MHEGFTVDTGYNGGPAYQTPAISSGNERRRTGEEGMEMMPSGGSKKMEKGGGGSGSGGSLLGGSGTGLGLSGYDRLPVDEPRSEREE